METIESIISGHVFFKDLKEEYLALIVGCAKNVIFKEGEIILEEGKPADYFYLIRGGLVAIEIQLGIHNPITIQTINEGDILGWSWLIPSHNNRFNCRAVEPTRMIAFDGKCLRGRGKQLYRLIIGGRTGKKNPRLANTFIDDASEEVVLAVCRNVYPFMKRYCARHLPKELMGYIIDRMGYEVFKREILGGTVLNPEANVAPHLDNPGYLYKIRMPVNS